MSVNTDNLTELREMLAEYGRLSRTSSEQAEALEPELLALAWETFPEHEDRILSAEDVAELLGAESEASDR